jgi:hypothetical protein
MDLSRVAYSAHRMQAPPRPGAVLGRVALRRRLLPAMRRLRPALRLSLRAYLAGADVPPWSFIFGSPEKEYGELRACMEEVLERGKREREERMREEEERDEEEREARMREWAHQDAAHFRRLEEEADAGEQVVVMASFAAVGAAAAVAASEGDRDRSTDLRRPHMPPRNSLCFFDRIRAGNSPRGFLIGMFGLDEHGLTVLENLIAPTLDAAAGVNRHKRLLSPRSQMLLTLFWLRSGTRMKTACMSANCTQSTATKYVFRVLDAVIEIIGRHPSGTVYWPCARARAFFAELVRDRLERRDEEVPFPAGPEDLGGVFAMLDGTHVNIDRPVKNDEDMVAYASRKKRHTANNQLLVSPAGDILMCSLNYPGSTHDSDQTRAAGIYRTVRSTPGPDNRLLVDSAYEACRPPGGAAAPGADGAPLAGRQIIASGDRNNSRRVAAQHVFLRQSVEWQMSFWKETFIVLASQMTSDHERRGKILLACVYLANFRVRVCPGTSELYNVYVEGHRGDLNANWPGMMQRYTQ